MHRAMPSSAAVTPSPIPLVVDLDRALVKSDLMVEAIFAYARQSPSVLLTLPVWLSGGRARVQRELAKRPIAMAVALLPYDEAVIERIRTARAGGRPVYLSSAFEEPVVGSIAAHLSLFDGGLPLDGIVQSGDTGAARLVDMFGEGGFDYIGSGEHDLPAWQHAATAVAVRTPRSVIETLQSTGAAVEELSAGRKSLRTWIRLLRLYQWSKNTLVIVPLLTAHYLVPSAIFQVLLAFVAFSLCASSTYIINDLIDVQADRSHPANRTRPFASGDLPMIVGPALAVGLFIGACLLAGSVSPEFLGVLVVYYATTIAYSVYLKRKMLIDVVTLAGLYTIRVVGGAVAVDLPVSEWILAFFM